MRKNLECFTHLEMYNRDPSKDCKSLFLQYVFVVHCLHNCVISASFSCGIETVFSMESMRMPRHVTDVDGGTNFLGLISRPKSVKRFLIKLKQRPF